MTVVFESGYSLPGGDEPLTHARIAHANNWITGGTVSTTGTATDYFEEGPDNSLTYEKWKPNGTTNEAWQLDFTSQAFDYCVIGAHNLGDSGSTLRVQEDDGGGGWDNLCANFSPSDNSPIFVIFAPTTNTSARVLIASTTTAPEIGVIKFGTALQMERPLYGGHAPVDMARVTTLRSNKSASGEFLGRTKLRTSRQNSFAWSNLSESWVRTNWVPFQKAVEEEPFFIAWRPDDSSTHKEVVGFGQVDEVPIPQTQGVRDLMSVSLSLTSYGYD